MLLDAEGVPWSAPDLTISFAPDGTQVAGYESTLFQSLGEFGASTEWQDAIVRGFETWAQHAAASISTQADSGDDFGTSGPTQGDSRFGDVRVAALPMANDIIAMSIPHDEVISGTWAGDILFNSNADLKSLDDIFSIAVHEAGHIFGLGHSNDPDSPMYRHAITTEVVRTDSDINALQRMYGIGLADGGSDGGGDGDDPDDPAESEQAREHQDDALGFANGLVLDASFQGAIRYAAAGQVFDSTDNDFYELSPVDEEFEQANRLTISVRATIPGTLIPAASIRNADGEIIESNVLSNANGELIIQAEADPREVHFVEVKAANPTGTYATGSYELVATFGTREVALNRIAKGTLKPDHATHAEVLHVSETRLVHFILATDPVETETSAVAWTVIYDAQGIPVFRTSAVPGDSRSANTLLLTPGDYAIEFHSDTPDGPNPTEIDFRLLAHSISIPIGPEPIDPTNVPILPCDVPGADPVYCYAEELAITDPIILPDPAQVTLPEPVVVIAPPLFDPDIWYWDGIIPPTDLPAPIGTAPPATSSWQNVARPHDVNGDSFVSPNDALVVVNFLNARGSQSLTSDHPAGTAFVDVNDDHFATPLDVLLIVNELNRSIAVTAEGEASPNSLGLRWPGDSPETSVPIANWGTTRATKSNSVRPPEQVEAIAKRLGHKMTLPSSQPRDTISLDEAIHLIATSQLEAEIIAPF